MLLQPINLVELLDVFLEYSLTGFLLLIYLVQEPKGFLAIVIRLVGFMTCQPDELGNIIAVDVVIELENYGAVLAALWCWLRRAVAKVKRHDDCGRLRAAAGGDVRIDCGRRQRAQVLLASSGIGGRRRRRRGAGQRLRIDVNSDGESSRIKHCPNRKSGTAWRRRFMAAIVVSKLESASGVLVLQAGQRLKCGRARGAKCIEIALPRR